MIPNSNPLVGEILGVDERENEPNIVWPLSSRTEISLVEVRLPFRNNQNRSFNDICRSDIQIICVFRQASVVT